MSRKTRMIDTGSKGKAGKATVEVKADPQVMARALELAGGDRSRITIKGDGAVIVHNNPVRGAR